VTFCGLQQRIQLADGIQSITVDWMSALSNLSVSSPVPKRVFGYSEKLSGVFNRQILVQLWHVGPSFKGYKSLQNLTKLGCRAIVTAHHDAPQHPNPESRTVMPAQHEPAMQASPPANRGVHSSEQSQL